jgi:hypothetical protein
LLFAFESLAGIEHSAFFNDFLQKIPTQIPRHASSRI